jgi:starch phosphorylase
LDGANVEIFDRVGRENGIVFGLTAEEVAAYQTNGTYSSWEIYNKDNDVRKLMDELGQHPNFEPLYRDLLDRNDEYFVLKDFKPYCAAQEKAEALYQNQRHWLSASAVNIAESGYFSSDRTIKEYARDIWHIKSLVYNR